MGSTKGNLRNKSCLFFNRCSNCMSNGLKLTAPISVSLPEAVSLGAAGVCGRPAHLGRGPAPPWPKLALCRLRAPTREGGSPAICANVFFTENPQLLVCPPTVIEGQHGAFRGPTGKEKRPCPGVSCRFASRAGATAEYLRSDGRCPHLEATASRRSWDSPPDRPPCDPSAATPSSRSWSLSDLATACP